MKIKCGDCGGHYGAKVWHSNDKYRRIVYTCNDKYKNECRCATPAITEDDIKGYFVKAINKLLEVKEETLENLDLLTRTACDTEALENELQQLRTEVGEIENELQSLISRNARMAIDQEEYNEKYGTLYGRYEKELARLNEIDDEILERNTRKIRIQKFTSNFMEIDDELTAFDEQLWGGLVEVMTVCREKKIKITFVGGIEVVVDGT